MHNVIRWITEIADADRGRLAPAELDKRLAALQELGRDGREMGHDQFIEVMTTAHFTHYFNDAISRAFYDDYAYMVGQWPSYVFQDVAPDFRNVDRYRMTEPEGLVQRREKGEMKATYIADSEVYYGVDEFSRQFDISWRTIMNDDLGKIAETPRRMARAAARWLDSFVSALYDNATTQATLAGLGAPWSGTGRLTAANLAIGLNAMMQRTDAGGNQMNISRVYLVIPPILQIQQADILDDILPYGGPGSNVLGRFVAGVFVDPYIATAGANVPWYLFADPADIPAVTLCRLQGMPGPITFMKSSDIRILSGVAPAAFTMGSFATGDIEFAVEDIVGGWDDASYVGVTDYRGVFYSSGTTI